MRILFVSNGYPPRQWAGTETYTAGLAQELHQRGHYIQVLCQGDWATGPTYWNGQTDELVAGIPVRRVHLNWNKAPDPFRYLYDNPVIGNYVRQYVDEIQPHLVHVTSCNSLSASILPAIKSARKPLVLSLTDFWFLCPKWQLLRHDGENCSGKTTAWECLRCVLDGQKVYEWPSRFLPKPVVSHLLTRVSEQPFLTRRRGLRGMAGDMRRRKKFLRYALAFPDIRLTASEFVRDIFEANGIDTPLKVQAYGHDLAWLKQYSGKSDAERLRVGFIGQITYAKGVHLLLEAITELQDKFADHFECYVYGRMDHDPSYGEQLRHIAEQAGNVSFCGTYRHEDSADIFAGIDVLVVPSLWYDFPLIIHEAFATETPVIATDLGGMAEAVTVNRDGLLFRRGDPRDLARQLARLVNEPGLLEQLKAGILPVKTVQDEVSELEVIYSELIQDSSRSQVS